MNIYGYYNYRTYLKDYYEYRKSMDAQFTYRSFLKDTGLKSSGIYIDIVRDRRKITLNVIKQFSIVMQLTEKEEQYFILMMHFTDAKTHATKQEIFEQMTAMLPRSIRSITRAQREYYQQWHHLAIKEALLIMNIDENYQDMARFLTPRVSPAKVKHTIKLLHDIDLIEKRDGYWRPKNNRIAGDHIDALTMHEVQKQFIDLGKESLGLFTKEKRNVSGTSMTVSQMGAERIIHKIDRFRQEIVDVLNSDTEENQVYHLNVQFFPLSKERN
ncbi:MAG: TIGR02147 family protein [Fibrobacterales bacterium]